MSGNAFLREVCFGDEAEDEALFSLRFCACTALIFFEGAGTFGGAMVLALDDSAFVGGCGVCESTTFLASAAAAGFGARLDRLGTGLRAGWEGDAGTDEASLKRDCEVKDAWPGVGETTCCPADGGSTRLDMLGDALARFGSWLGARGDDRPAVP